MLELANTHLENARKAQEKGSPLLALVHCDDADSTLYHMKRTTKLNTNSTEDITQKDVAIAYFELGRIQDLLGEKDKAQNSFKKAQKLE